MVSKELFNALEKALLKMEESLSFPKTEPMMESTIQRFEYTFELSWKLMNSILKDQNIDSFGVKNIVRDSARLWLISEISRWFDFAKSRNESSHIYKEEVAKRVYGVVTSDFVENVRILLENSKEYVN